MDTEIKAAIVDDSPFALEALQTLLQKKFPDIIIDKTFTDPLESVSYLKKNPVNLLFLDVQMPGLNGFELLEKIGGFKGHVIFTTSHDKFAAQAFRYHALDYLVKPVEYKLLKEAVEKLDAVKKSGTDESKELLQKAQHLKLAINKLAIPTMEGMIFLDINHIVRCESDNVYTIVYLEKDKIVSSKNLGHYENMLAERGFFRVHTSHLINLNHIKKYIKGDGAYVVMSDDTNITIARRRKEEFMQLFE
jgi:two-component system LytT family response regulator